MTAVVDTCGACGEQIRFLTGADVDFFDCPECGSEHCVTPLGASLVGEIPAEKEERFDKLREWDEEVLND